MENFGLDLNTYTVIIPLENRKGVEEVKEAAASPHLVRLMRSNRVVSKVFGPTTSLDCMDLMDFLSIGEKIGSHNVRNTKPGDMIVVFRRILPIDPHQEFLELSLFGEEFGKVLGLVASDKRRVPVEEGELDG